jgi:hypothetical protein
MEWLLIFGVIAVVALVAALVVTRRPSRALRDQFGQEYDRVVAEEGGDRRTAEAKLRDLAKRREELDIRELPPEAKETFTARWREIQLAFVEDPAESVAAADNLVDEVVRERGYPAHDEEERLDMLSVDHPGVIENYRAAVTIRRNDQQTAEIDLLRVAFQSYRSLFEEVTR